MSHYGRLVPRPRPESDLAYFLRPSLDGCHLFRPLGVGVHRIREDESMVTESREVGRDQGVVPGFATAPGSAVDEVHYSFSCFNVVFRVFRVFRVIRTFHCRRVIIQIFPPAIATATTTATAARNSLHPPPQTDEPAEDFVGVRRREEGTGEFHTKVGEETDEAGVAKVVGGPGGEEATGEG